MSISWPPHYNSMVKNEVPLMRIRSAQITQNHNQIGYAWYPRRAVASFPRWKVIWGHIMTSSGRQRFLPITFDRNELETWGCCHSVRLVKALLDMQLYKYLYFLYIRQKMSFPVSFCFTLEFLLPINYPHGSATSFCSPHLPTWIGSTHGLWVGGFKKDTSNPQVQVPTFCAHCIIKCC